MNYQNFLKTLHHKFFQGQFPSHCSQYSTSNSHLPQIAKFPTKFFFSKFFEKNSNLKIRNSHDLDDRRSWTWTEPNSFRERCDGTKNLTCDRGDLSWWGSGRKGFYGSFPSNPFAQWYIYSRPIHAHAVPEIICAYAWLPGTRNFEA